MTLIVVLLLIAMAWGGGMRANQAKIAEVERSADAMSEAIESIALGNDFDKLDKVLLDIADAGKYSSVSYSDNTGKILATTDSVRRGKKSEAMAKSPEKAKAITENGRLVVRRAVILAGSTRFGNIEIVH